MSYDPYCAIIIGTSVSPESFTMEYPGETYCPKHGDRKGNFCSECGAALLTRKNVVPTPFLKALTEGRDPLEVYLKEWTDNGKSLHPSDVSRGNLHLFTHPLARRDLEARPILGCKIAEIGRDGHLGIPREEVGAVFEKLQSLWEGIWSAGVRHLRQHILMY